MSDIQVKYDAQVDILRIRLDDTPIEESEQVETGIIVDYDEAGNVVGLEILDASEMVSRAKAAALVNHPSSE
ncbi:MAG: DUF2283 domain-containing protein [Chloroflexi bacterium]|nr:DUF2283 domain-containing protein [Chloroflexota bacterium]